MVDMANALFKNSLLQSLRGYFVMLTCAPPWRIQGSTDAIRTVMSQMPSDIYEIHDLSGFTFSGLDPRDKRHKTVMRGLNANVLVP